MSVMSIPSAAIASVFMCALAIPASADPVEDFYKGKTVTIWVGYGTGDHILFGLRHAFWSVGWNYVVRGTFHPTAYCRHSFGGDEHDTSFFLIL